MATKKYDLKMIPLDREHFFEMVELSFIEGLFEFKSYGSLKGGEYDFINGLATGICGRDGRKENGDIIFTGHYECMEDYFPVNEFVISNQNNTVTVRNWNEGLNVMEDMYTYDFMTHDIILKKKHYLPLHVPCRLELDRDNDICVYAICSFVETNVHPDVYDEVYDDIQTKYCTLFDGRRSNKYDSNMYCPIILSKQFSLSLPPK